MMKDSKFFKLFNSLDRQEIKDFEKFLKRLYPGRHKEQDLLRYIKKHYLLETNTLTLEKDITVKKVLKTIPSANERKRLDNLLSNLFKYLEGFLLWEKTQKRSHSIQLQLLEIYKERHLDSLFFQKIENVKRELQKTPEDTIGYHLDLMRLHHDTFFHTNFPKIKPGAIPLEQCMQHLDTFFCLTKLKLAMEMLNRQNILQEQYDIYFLNEAIHYLTILKKSSSIFIPLVEFLQAPSEEGFEFIKDQLFQGFKTLPSDEQLIVISYLLNYTSAEIKLGKISAYQKAFELYQFGLKNKIFIGEDGYISTTKFANIAAVGCRVRRFEWVEKFIQTWSEYLNQKQRKNTVLMAKSYLEFEQGNFKEVITLSSLVTFGEDYFSLRTRGIVLCSFYELNHKTNPNLIQDYCNSYAQFIRRNSTINKSTLESFFALIKFVRLLLRRNVLGTHLQKEIQNSDFMFGKSWVLKKIEQIKKEKV